MRRKRRAVEFGGRTLSRLGVLAAIAAHWVGAGALHAQEVEEPVFTERVDVELVTVDLWVEDESGAAVPGLGPADFEILHDGEPVDIRYFSEIRRGMEIVTAVEAATAMPPTVEVSSSASSGPAPNHVIVFFDQSRLHPTNYPRLVKGIEEFLDAEGVEPEQVLVVRQDRGLFVEAPLGSSRADLRVALGRLKSGSSAGTELQSESTQAIEAVRRIWEESQGSASSAAAGIASIPSTTPGTNPGGAPLGGPRAAVGGVGTAGGSDACGSFLGQVQPILASWSRTRGQRVEATLSTLADVVSFVSGLPGMKTLLYLSDGLDTRPGEALANYAAGLCPTGATQLLAGDRQVEMTSRFLELARHANANRVTLYALHAPGLETTETGSASAGRRPRGAAGRSAGAYERARRSADRSGLELMAGETGGRAIFNRNEFGPVLRDLASELRSYYSIAYARPSSPGTEERIEVRMPNRELTARYRRGSIEKDARQRLAERLEGALNLGIVENALGVRLGAGDETAGEGGVRRLPLLIVVPVESVTWMPQTEGSMAEIFVRVMTRSLDGGPITVVEETFQLRGSAEGGGFAQLTLPLELPAGGHLVAVGVLDSVSKQSSFVATSLALGGAEAGR